MKITHLSPALALTGIAAALVLAGCPSSQKATNETLANVGTSAITRADLGKFLEAQSGEQALPYLIDTQLLFEAAKAKGVEVTDADVEADLARRQTTDPSIATALKDNALRADIIKQQIRRDLTVQRLLVADVKADDAKVKAFFEKNRAYYDVPGKVQIGLLMTSQKARADAMARELKSKSKNFAALVEEQKKAQDPAAQSSTADRGPLGGYDAYGPAGTPLRAALEKAAKGTVTDVQTIPVGPNQSVYAIFNVIDKTPVVKADLTKLRPTIETDYKMYEVATAEIKKNPANPQKIEDNLSRVAEELRRQSPTAAPTMRDILTFILRPKAESELAALRTAGTVTIADPLYTKVGDAYKTAAAPAAGAPGAPGAPAAPGAPSEAPAPGAAAPAAPAAPATP